MGHKSEESYEISDMAFFFKFIYIKIVQVIQYNENIIINNFFYLEVNNIGYNEKNLFSFFFVLLDIFILFFFSGIIRRGTFKF